MTVQLTKDAKAAIMIAVLEKDKYIVQIKEAYKKQYGKDLTDDEIEDAIKQFMKVPAV